MKKGDVIKVDKYHYTMARDKLIQSIRDPSIKDYSDDIDVVIEHTPKSISFGPWRSLQRILKMPVVVYDEKGVYKKIVYRAAYPRTPLGCWAVFAFKYKGKWYKSLVDDIWGYLQVKEVSTS